MNQPIKNKTRWIVLICLLMLCIGPFGSLSAPPGDRTQKDNTFKRKSHFPFLTDNNLFDGRLLLKMKEKISLTRKQEEKIENLMLEHEALYIRISAEIKIKELRFAAYLKAGKMDRKEMAAHIREISREKTNLIVHYMNYLLDLRSLLTPQQLETLKQIKEREKKSRFRDRKTS